MNTRFSKSLPFRRPTARFQPRRQGFSLIEVTMAIGLISFAMLSVLGLMPVGLNTLRKAMNQTVEGQIVQKMSGRFLLTPFSQLRTSYSTSQSFYYDQEGEEVPDAGTAAFKVTAFPPTNAIYPGSSNAPTSVTNSLVAMPIEVLALQGGSTNRFIVHVPNSGN